MELQRLSHRAGDEHLPDAFLAEARRPTGGVVVEVPAGGFGVVRGRALIPVVDVAFGIIGVVGPFGALGVGVVVVVDDVEDDRDAAAMALAHKVFEFVAARRR